MPRSRSLSLTLLSLATVAIAACESGPIVTAESPFRESWNVVHEGPILIRENAAVPYAPVRTLVIGGIETADNFANRGDVEVYFTNPPSDAQGLGTIRIEWRRFAFATDQADADANFEKMTPWAFATTTQNPNNIDPALNCFDPVWFEGCSLRVYYDGKTQPIRSGADLRVYLPSDYVGDLQVITEDNLKDTEYFDLSNVKVKGAIGSVDVSVENGDVEIEMSDDALVAPQCGADLAESIDFNEFCETYVDMNTSMPAPWSVDCGCTELGQVKAEARLPFAANITIDIPTDLWANVKAENLQAGLTTASMPRCDATIEDDTFASFEFDPSQCDPSAPWRCFGEANDPGASAVEGAGFGVQARSNGCGIVDAHSGPEDYGTEPEPLEKGFTRVCSGCLDIPVP